MFIAVLKGGPRDGQHVMVNNDSVNKLVAATYRQPAFLSDVSVLDRYKEIVYKRVDNSDIFVYQEEL